jgi:large subunit ribosomal protein L25
MMEEFVLKAEERTEFGSAASRRMRRSGRIPCVLYGQGKETAHLLLDDRELRAALRAKARVLDIDAGGETERALIKEIQYGVYGDRVEHMDLLRVVKGEKIEVEVAFDFFGTPKGVTEENGVLDTAMTKLLVECIPSAIPAAIEVDVRDLAVGDLVRVADVALPEGVKALDDAERVVVGVLAPKAAEEEETDLEGPAEPEVITASKSDEESE